MPRWLLIVPLILILALVAGGVIFGLLFTRGSGAPAPLPNMGILNQMGMNGWYIGQDPQPRMVMVFVDQRVRRAASYPATLGSGRKGHFELWSDVKIDFVSRTEDGLSGSIQIDGQSFDLTKGAVFLYYSGESPARIVQRNIHPVKFGGDVDALVEADAETKTFIEAAKSAKKK